MDEQEKKYQERKLFTLRKTATAMGFELVARQAVALPVS